MLRLTWDGVALHSGVIGSRPSSHGCVRLPREFAKRLFQTAKCGDMVTIVSDEQSMPDPTLPRNPEPPKIEVKQTAKLPPPAKVAVTASTNSPTVPQPVKTMAQLERDERGIREDNSLTQAARMQKLRDVWAQQLQLMKSH